MPRDARRAESIWAVPVEHVVVILGRSRCRSQCERSYQTGDYACPSHPSSLPRFNRLGNPLKMRLFRGKKQVFPSSRASDYVRVPGDPDGTDMGNLRAVKGVSGVQAVDFGLILDVFEDDAYTCFVGFTGARWRGFREYRPPRSATLPTPSRPDTVTASGRFPTRMRVPR